jgi:hypothetical protein
MLPGCTILGCHVRLAPSGAAQALALCEAPGRSRQTDRTLVGTGWVTAPVPPDPVKHNARGSYRRSQAAIHFRLSCRDSSHTLKCDLKAPTDLPYQQIPHKTNSACHPRGHGGDADCLRAADSER